MKICAEKKTFAMFKSSFAREILEETRHHEDIEDSFMPKAGSIINVIIVIKN